MKRLGLLLAALGLVIVGFVVAINRYLPLSNQLEKADVIVVVSGGDTRGRTLHGIELYEQGFAPKLIFSGAAKDPASASNAKAMLAIAAARGVSPGDIVLDEFSRDTKENAIGTKELAKAYKKIILVTSPYHQRRAYNEFSRAFGQEVRFINSPAQDKNWRASSWYLSPYGWWITATETAKLLFTQVDA